MYSSRLLNSVEENYTTIEKEALAMVYVLHKSNTTCQATCLLLCGPYGFSVFSQQATSFWQVSQMALLFLEYDFKIVYKPGRSHLMADALSRLPNQTEPVGIPDQTCDAHMFTLQPKWLQNVYEYLLEGVMLERFTTSQRQYLTQRAKPFVLQEGILYKFGQDNKFC